LPAVLVRQILGGVAEFEKTTLVAKLKAAQERKKAVTGKSGGRKSFAERDAVMVALAKKLRRYPVNGRKRSHRDVAVALGAGLPQRARQAVQSEVDRVDAGEVVMKLAVTRWLRKAGD
jgi:hypothetical protein